MHKTIEKRAGKFVRKAFPGECGSVDGYRDAYCERHPITGEYQTAQPTLEGPKGVVFGNHLYTRQTDGSYAFHSHGYGGRFGQPVTQDAYLRAVCGL